MAYTFDRTHGQVAASEAAILTTSGNQRVMFTLNFHNTDTVDREIEVWLKVSSTGRKLVKETMQADSTITITDKHVLNATTDSVTAVADAAATIDYWLSFIEIA